MLEHQSVDVRRELDRLRVESMRQSARRTRSKASEDADPAGSPEKVSRLSHLHVAIKRT